MLIKLLTIALVLNWIYILPLMIGYPSQFGMGWIVFELYISFGGIFDIARYLSERLASERAKKISRKVSYIFLALCLIVVAGALLYIVGWVWYYFCAGFLVIEEDSWTDKILFGLMSLGGLLYLAGFVAILFGANPFRR